MPLRILVASTYRAHVGGVESYLRALIPALREGGHDVSLLYERPAAARVTVDADADIPAWSTHTLGAARALAEATSWEPQVAYVHGLDSPALEAAILKRWPSVLFAHNYYGTCETGTKRHAFPHIAFCTRRFGPACLLLHYPRRCGGLNPVVLGRMYRLQAARGRLLTRYRAICVASRHMQQEYRRQGIPRERLHVLPLPPTGIERDPNLPSVHPPAGRLAMLARLTDLKGGDLLLQALPLASRQLGIPLSLTVAGDGPERPRLERRARAQRLDVHFAGWVDPAARNRIIREADLLVLPSVWPEPWGLAGLEAACAGVPTVAFAAGGIPEWLEPGVSGELAPASPPTAAGLAAAIARALGDADHYARLRLGAWQGAARYSMEHHLHTLLLVLARAASDR
jgi:glycosyltransferase involved in cell wall biosynthesis